MVSLNWLRWSMLTVLAFGALAVSALVVRHLRHPVIMPPVCPAGRTCFATTDLCLYAYPVGFDSPGTRHSLEVRGEHPIPVIPGVVAASADQKMEVFYDGVKLNPVGCMK